MPVGVAIAVWVADADAQYELPKAMTVLAIAAPQAPFDVFHPITPSIPTLFNETGPLSHPLYPVVISSAFN